MARSFEAFEVGAVMPVWSQRQAGTFALEAQLRLPEDGGFALRLLTRDRRAARRHEFEPPLGPAR